MAARRDVAGAVALAGTLGIAAAGWLVTVRQMDGMDMGVATELGPFASFAGLWLAMMAAMMLPAAAPAVTRRVRAQAQAGAGAGIRGVAVFLATYLAVWTLVGVVAYLLYRPHGSLAAGLAVMAAGLYELTPVKRRQRRYCRERADSGVAFGLHCLGSSVGLMLALVALGPMSLTWMTVFSGVVLAQKLWPANAAIDVPFAFAVIVFGALTVVTPGSIPGLMS
jgi:predicted metal-binding membrane protein